MISWLAGCRKFEEWNSEPISTEIKYFLKEKSIFTADFSIFKLCFRILKDVNSQPPSFLAISCLIVSSNIMVVKAGRNFVKRMESTNSCGRDWEDAMSAAAAPRARTRAITKRDGISLGKWPDWNENQVFSLINLFWIFCFSEFANFGELWIIYRIPQFLDSDSSHLMNDMHVSGDHSQVGYHLEENKINRKCVWFGWDIFNPLLNYLHISSFAGIQNRFDLVSLSQIDVLISQTGI